MLPVPLLWAPVVVKAEFKVELETHWYQTLFTVGCLRVGVQVKAKYGKLHVITIKCIRVTTNR